MCRFPRFFEHPINKCVSNTCSVACAGDTQNRTGVALAPQLSVCRRKDTPGYVVRVGAGAPAEDGALGERPVGPDPGRGAREG